MIQATALRTIEAQVLALWIALFVEVVDLCEQDTNLSNNTRAQALANEALALMCFVYARQSAHALNGTAQWSEQRTGPDAADHLLSAREGAL